MSLKLNSSFLVTVLAASLFLAGCSSLPSAPSTPSDASTLSEPSNHDNDSTVCKPSSAPSAPSASSTPSPSSPSAPTVPLAPESPGKITSNKVAKTSNKSAHCSAVDVHTITQPLFPGDSSPNSAFFTYSFRLIKAKSINAPTIIYLPGGPGGPSMDRNPAKWMEKYNYVFTDVRGSGCNEFSVEDMPDNAIRTEYAAQDIAAIVDYLDDPNKSGIQLGKYIIHGSSYGTVLATVSGHKIQNSLTPKPTAIILEGTLGRQRQFTYEYQSSTISGYVDQISRRLPAEIFSILGGSEPPFGLTKSEWVFWMEALMTKGSQITEAGEAKFYRHGLESFMLSKPTAEMIQEIKDAYKSNAENRIKETRAYPNLACRELFVCKDVALDRSFDSADYQLHTPLYYFHGTFDPRTLLEEGRYHFDNQYYSEKYFITFKEGGHGPLQLELASGMHNIFERIVEGRGSIELLFDKWINAGVPLVVETAGPGFVASQY